MNSSLSSAAVDSGQAPLAHHDAVVPAWTSRQARARRRGASPGGMGAWHRPFSTGGRNRWRRQRRRVETSGAGTGTRPRAAGFIASPISVCYKLTHHTTPHHATASARSFVSSRLVDRPTGVTPRKAYGTQGLREGRFNLYYSTRFIWR